MSKQGLLYFLVFEVCALRSSHSFPKLIFSNHWSEVSCIRAWYISCKVAWGTRCLTCFMVPMPEETLNSFQVYHIFVQDLRVINLSCAYQRPQKIMACLPSATLRPFNFIMYLPSVTLCVTHRLTNICTVAVQLINRMTTKCSFTWNVFILS